ncbi:hypothetical protein [Listeria grayi]|uniref:hypothetical protein n=1 Tax=Listeria grayi TaxID=1641 RepID=UPI0016279129|nr:hypothetical protein [Listeria grayi]MBC1920834.1 hypothetical protein [Listeria grayi]
MKGVMKTVARYSAVLLCILVLVSLVPEIYRATKKEVVCKKINYTGIVVKRAKIYTEIGGSCEEKRAEKGTPLIVREERATADNRIWVLAYTSDDSRIGWIERENIKKARGD